ncbi:hypothetical protein BC936DRAFT_138503 [Jimgerdemannia flammicorona]|uniref:Major facilitator superfamily domain-containing protein n=1 Tax=Jimgerdemannia flammicorona TaxID=994334 RepID=A0A433C9Y7_9FUNG|nr:hypothetical protein BC936DRAFT_138503 [Jimgerdemannia flammicorona]
MPRRSPLGHLWPPIHAPLRDYHLLHRLGRMRRCTGDLVAGGSAGRRRDRRGRTEHHVHRRHERPCVVAPAGKIPGARQSGFCGMFKFPHHTLLRSASLIGAPLGGYITDNFSWRYCFYINLPLLLVCFLITTTQITNYNLQMDFTDTYPLFNKLKRIDYFGSGSLVLGVTGLLLGTAWGGNTMPWTSPIVVACIVDGVVMLFVFGAYLAMARVLGADAVGGVDDQPLLEHELVRHDILRAAVLPGCLWLKRVPSWAQPSPQGDRCGDRIPLGGSADGAQGHVPVFDVVCVLADHRGLFRAQRLGARTRPHVAVRRAALLRWVRVWVGTNYYAGCAVGERGRGRFVVFCLSVGICLLPVEYSSISTHWYNRGALADIAVAASMSYLFRATGGVMGVSICSAVFQALLKSELIANIHGPDADLIIDTARKSVDAIRTLPAEYKDIVIAAYFHGIQCTFSVVIVFAVLAFVSSLFIQKVKLSNRVPVDRS